MATITKSNKDNFLTWEKVNGVLTLAELQASGLPDRKTDDIGVFTTLKGNTALDTLQGSTVSDTLKGN